MKKYFLTGLAILLPIFLTYQILRFLVNVLSKPFLAAVETFLAHFNLLDQGQSILAISSKLISLVLLFGLIILVGMICKRFFVRGFLIYMDNLLHRLPLIKPLYKPTKELVDKLFRDKQPRFKKVVLIPFPNSNARSLALVTHEDGDKVYVLLAGTPNPTLGFVLTYSKEQVIYTNIKVEDAVKMVLSCGLIPAV